MNTETTHSKDLNPAAPSARDSGHAAVKLDSAKSWFFLGCLMLGYIGIYLCRKNLSVAVPMIQKSFGVNKAQTGLIASTATLAYMFGKIIFGPWIDKVGGRLSFILAMLGVAIFGGLGAMAGSVGMLVALYTGNRACGAAGWGSMVKMVPDWFSPRRMAMAMALLAMSYAFGGYCAIFLAGKIATWSGESWRAVMGLPSLLLLAILTLCWFVLPKSSHKEKVARETASSGVIQNTPLQKILIVSKIPQFWVICGMSFVLTITRDFFNDWTVDFFKTSGGIKMSTEQAAMLSTSFDLAGAVGILLLGALLQKIGLKTRTWLLATMLFLLGCLIYSLPELATRPLWIASMAIGCIGFLSYGPYSLLSGILSVEIKGKDYVATVAGFVDASGYLAGVLAGAPFGWILDHKEYGYRMGFHVLALTSLVAVLLCFFLSTNPNRAVTNPEPKV